MLTRTPFTIAPATPEKQSNMTPQDILIKAAELLDSAPTAWTQKHIARDEGGWPEPANHPNACSWCALGAIAKAQNLPDAPQGDNPAAKLLASHLGVNIVDWNDNPLRTREDVIQGLREAAKLQTVTL
jgi:hypothetical protein